MNPSSSSSESRRNEEPLDPVVTTECPSPLPESAVIGQTQGEGMSGRLEDVEPESSRFRFLSAARGPDELGWIGSYRIRGVLGEGGMGVVFDAEDSQLCRRVALKILKPELALTPRLRERFLQEARAAAALSPEHVVSIYQVGNEGDVPYLAMQYLEGESLEQCLHRVHRLPAGEVARIGRDIALGLSEAHEKGLIHRDIKPANIWLEKASGSAVPRVKLLDFGLARVTGSVSNLTASGMIVGTPHYLAPEQARGLDLDHRCDLFALGCVLYRALTGTLAFDGSDLLSLLSSLAIDEPRPIHNLAPEAPAEMVQLIRELLAKSPSQRPASAREVAERLRGLVDLPTSALPLPTYEPCTLTAKAPAKELRKAGPSRFGTGLFLGGVLTSMVLILGLWGWIKIGNQPANPTIDCSLQGHPIPVGVLHMRSGPWASVSAPLVESIELAINEINDQGGVLGGRVEPILVDGSSDESALASEANRLILENHVCALFGCCSPAGRKQVLPVVERHNHLLFYPLPCEGLEQSPNIVYVGAAPNQQILPGLQFVLGTLHKRRLFLVGSDGVYSRTAHAMLRDAVAQASEAQIVGEALFPLGGGDAKDAVAKIRASNADLILNTMSGDTNVVFFRALRAAGVTPAQVPTLSFSLDANQLRALPAESMIGDYAAWNYFQSINRPENTAFVRKFQARFGTHRVLTDAMESAYAAVHLWARAAKEANDTTASLVRPTLRGLETNGPGGPIRIDPVSQFAWKVVRVGQIGERGQFKIVWSSEEPVAPQPFPATRKREQWLQFLEGLQRDYGDRGER